MSTQTHPISATPLSSSPVPGLAPAQLMISPQGKQALAAELAELLGDPTTQPAAGADSEEPTGGDVVELADEAIRAARIEALRTILASAVVVDPSAESGVAGLGSIVTLRSSGRTLERRLLGAYEPIGPDGVSVASPIGAAIFGTSAGDLVTAELPDGRKIEFEVVAVRAA